jgi:NUMOD4 motif-containing protein
MPGQARNTAIIDAVDELEETWRPYPGYAGWYEVSDLGRVASLARATTRGKILRASLNAKGHHQVSLSKYGATVVRPVGRMVLEAHRGSCPEGCEARWGDGGKEDDRLANLRWGSKYGSRNQGERSARAKMTDAIVLECRGRLDRGEATEAELAAEFGVSQSAMSNALRGRTWAHLPGSAARRARFGIS